MRGTRVALVAAGVVLASSVASAPVAAGPPSGGALPAPAVQEIEIAGKYGVPADALMVAVNVTAVNTSTPGYLAVHACDTDAPGTSNVNYATDQAVPNLALSALSADGTVCVSTSALTDLVVDVIGYVPAGSAITPLAAPERFLDSRDPGGAASPLAAGASTEVQITGRAGIPDTATVVMANVTAVAGSAPGYLTVAPCGTTPDTSSVNHLPGEVNANLVVSALDADGRVCIENLAPVDVVVDVVAWANDGITTLPTPERIVDTRTSGLTAGDRDVLRVDLVGDHGVPADATAAVYNLTATRTTGPGYLTSYPCDVERPVASNLNHTTGDTAANATITKLSAAGELCFFTLVATDVIVDLIGWTTGTDHYVAITPTRALDTRRGWRPECDLMIVVDGEGPRWGALRRGRPDSEVVWLDVPSMSNSGPTMAPGCDFGYSVDLLGQAWEIPLNGDDATKLGDVTADVGLTVVFPLADGRVLATTPVAATSRYRLFDIRTDATLLEFDVAGGAPGFSVSADGSLLGYWSNTFRVVDVATGDIVAERADLPAARLSPDGRYYSYAFVDDGRAYCEVATLSGRRVHQVLYPSVITTAWNSPDPCAWASTGVLYFTDIFLNVVYRATLFGSTSPIFEIRTDERIWSLTGYR